MTTTTKDDLLKRAKRVKVRVAVPELDTELILTSLSATVALELADLNVEKEKGATGVDRRMMLLLVQSAIIDEAGKPVFGGDVKAAGEFLDAVSVETINLLAEKTPGFSKKKEDGVAAPGPSKASLAPAAG